MKSLVFFSVKIEIVERDKCTYKYKCFCFKWFFELFLKIEKNLSNCDEQKTI